MHNAGVRGETGKLAGHAVIKACAHADDKVGVIEGHVGGVGAVHAAHAEPEGILRGEAADAHEAAGHGDMQGFGHFRDGRGSVRKNDAAAGENHRIAGLLDFLDSLVELADVGLVRGIVGAHINRLGPHKLGFAYLHILGQVHQHGSGTARTREEERLTNRRGEIPDVLHEIVMLRAGAGDAGDIDFLERVIADEPCGDLPGKENERNGITVCSGQTRYRIGGAGAGSYQCCSYLTGSAGIAVSGMKSCLFVAY